MMSHQNLTLPPIPEPRIVTTGDQHLLTQTIDDFFRDTQLFLEQTQGAERRYFKRRSGELAYHPSDTIRLDYPRDGQITNDSNNLS